MVQWSRDWSVPRDPRIVLVDEHPLWKFTDMLLKNVGSAPQSPDPMSFIHGKASRKRSFLRYSEMSVRCISVKRIHRSKFTAWKISYIDNLLMWNKWLNVYGLCLFITKKQRYGTCDESILQSSNECTHLEIRQSRAFRPSIWAKCRLHGSAKHNTLLCFIMYTFTCIC